MIFIVFRMFLIILKRFWSFCEWLIMMTTMLFILKIFLTNFLRILKMFFVILSKFSFKILSFSIFFKSCWQFFFYDYWCWFCRILKVFQCFEKLTVLNDFHIFEEVSHYFDKFLFIVTVFQRFVHNKSCHNFENVLQNFPKPVFCKVPHFLRLRWWNIP